MSGELSFDLCKAFIGQGIRPHNSSVLLVNDEDLLKRGVYARSSGSS